MKNGVRLWKPERLFMKLQCKYLIYRPSLIFFYLFSHLRFKWWIQCNMFPLCLHLKLKLCFSYMSPFFCTQHRVSRSDSSYWCMFELMLCVFCFFQSHNSDLFKYTQHDFPFFFLLNAYNTNISCIGLVMLPLALDYNENSLSFSIRFIQ